MKIMAHTKYQTYQTEELLKLCQDKRCYSPLIDELCIRLENMADPEAYPAFHCPVCETELYLNDSPIESRPRLTTTRN